MPLYEQVYHIRRADVMVGLHGSGMSNVKLMRPGTGLIEIMPYQAKGHALSYGFGGVAVAKGGAYKVVDIPKEDCIMHWLYNASQRWLASKSRRSSETAGLSLLVIFSRSSSTKMSV